MDLEKRKKEMYAMIEQWQATGLSQTAWCKEVGMSRSTLRKWLQRYEAKHNVTPPMVEQSTSSHDPSFVSIELPSSVNSQLNH